MPRPSVLGLILLAAGAAFAPETAFAHTEAGNASGFAHGFLHPIGGLDHVLAMVAVGMFAANLGGRALWAVPLAFVAVMVLGGVLGAQQVELPYVESAIALSVVVLGLAVAMRAAWPVAAAMALVAVLAVFHGHAHGAEMPMNASGAGYAAGFMLATAILHLAGIGLGMGTALWSRTAPLAGSAMAFAGVALLIGIL
jgi:urease accessory protein